MGVFEGMFASRPWFLAYMAIFQLVKVVLGENKWYIVVFVTVFASLKARETLLTKIKGEEDTETPENEGEE